MVKKVVAFALALVVSCACLGACSGSQQASSSSSLQDALYALKETSLLESPSADAKVLAKVAIGKAAKLVGIEGDYSKVRALGKEGYILSADLTDSESDAKTAKKVAEAAAEEAAKAAEEAARAEAEEKERAEAEERARVEAEETARAEAQAQADADAAAQAQAAATAAQAQAEAEAAARAAAEAEAAKQPTVVSKEYVPPCDGHADGYTVIVYSDGTETLVEGKA